MSHQPTGPSGVDRRTFLRWAGVGAAALALGDALRQPTRPAGRKPNIIVIVADDLGYADLGCQGSTDVRTPHIDSIAASGVRFTQGYVSCPVCSPTRAGLLTGRYQQRFGHEFNPGNPEPANFGVPLTEHTLADLLHQAGYRTGMVGKWHLGTRPAYHPLKRGFDDFYGFLGGAHSYVKLAPDARRSIFRGEEPVAEEAYLTDAFAREAVAFIGRHKADPFFLYLPFNAVHAPLDEPPRKYLDRFQTVADRTRRTFLAMLSAMDDAVGAVLAKLRELKLEDDTLIFFLSDNGGPTSVNTSRNDPLRGVKTTVFEGGIRVPFLMQWKGHVPAGKVEDRPVIALDVVPTALHAAGATLPDDRPIDGVGLLPSPRGTNDGAWHEALFWRFGRQTAVRQGDWKLVRLPGSEWSLYDLRHDAGEQTDLAAQKPEMVKELQAAYDAWEKQLIAPLWGQGGARRRRQP